MFKKYSGLTAGYVVLFVWHVYMNSTVYFAGWYGYGLSAFIECQIMGIPFVIDHWIKWTALYAVTQIILFTYRRFKI